MRDSVINLDKSLILQRDDQGRINITGLTDNDLFAVTFDRDGNIVLLPLMVAYRSRGDRDHPREEDEVEVEIIDLRDDASVSSTNFGPEKNKRPYESGDKEARLEFYKKVAKIFYRYAEDYNKPSDRANRAIAQAFNMNTRLAGLYVSFTRKAGLLPETADMRRKRQRRETKLHIAQHSQGAEDNSSV